MIANPPQFNISNKCCHYAKKMVAKRFKDQEKFELNMYGVRKAEGGARRSAYKTCFLPVMRGVMNTDLFFGIYQIQKVFMKRIIILEIADAIANMD